LLLVVFVRVPVTEDAALPDTPPVNPDPDGADQVNVVPAGTRPLVPSVGFAVNVPPLQIVAVILVIAGIG
jgi:hypothetical protein